MSALGNSLRRRLALSDKADFFIEEVSGSNITKSDIEGWFFNTTPVIGFKREGNKIRFRLKNPSSVNPDFSNIHLKIRRIIIYNKDYIVPTVLHANFNGNHISIWSLQENLTTMSRYLRGVTSFNFLFINQLNPVSFVESFRDTSKGKVIVFNKLTQLSNGSSNQFLALNCKYFSANKAILLENQQGLVLSGETFITRGEYENTPSGVNQQLDYIRNQFTNVVYAQNYTLPPTPTNITTTQVSGTYAELDLTLPTHVNDYLGYMILANGFFVAFIEDITNFFAVGLNPSSINRVELRLVDEYFNISQPARISVLTPAIDTVALFQNAVAYWKLDETSGDAVDIVNGYNGTLFGGVTQGVAGKIGTAYSFDGTGYINLGAIDYDEIQISCWFKTTDTTNDAISLFGQGNQVQGEVLRFRLNNGVISAPVFGGIVEFGNNTFNDGNWHLLSVSLPSKTSNTSEFELRVDNVLQPITSDPNINMNIDTSQPFIIGSDNITTFNFKGEIDEFLINNTRLNLAENSDLYNNGNGTTI